MTSNDKLTIGVNEQLEEKDVNKEFQEAVRRGSQPSQEEQEEAAQDYFDSKKIAYAIVDIISLYPEVRNDDGTYDERAIRRLLFDPTNLENPIAWGDARKEYLKENPKSISPSRTSYFLDSVNYPIEDIAMGIYNISDLDELWRKMMGSRARYKKVNKLREMAESFIKQANDQIDSGRGVSDNFVTKYIESYKPTWDSGSDDESEKSDPSDAFGSSDDEDASSPSGNDRALSTFEESLFRTASEANDIVDRLKELYNEVYDGRGISSAQERAEPGWKPSYLDRQFDLRIMDIEEQSKSRNRALILTMAGIDLRGEMEEARKLISFKTKELRDIGHDPDGFRRAQYQKQSQFLLQSFGLLMQIAPNAFGAKYGITQNAWALSNDLGRRQMSNMGNQYAGGTPISLAVSADKPGEQ